MKTKIDWLSILRAILTAIGSFLIGKSIFGYGIDDINWQTIVGIIISIGSLIMAIKDKAANIEMWQSVLRQILIFVGGILVAAGIMTGKNLEAILALIPVLIPVIQSYTARVKINQIESGKVSTEQLKK